MYFSNILACVNLKTTAGVIGASVGLFTLVKGTLEYIKQGTQKRVELYFRMVEKFEQFSDLCALLECQDTEQDAEKLRTLPYERKFNFVGFFEDLALMAESGLIRYRLANYAFGFYAIRCWESDIFWDKVHGVDRNEPYWGLFRSFVERMKQEDAVLLGRGKKAVKFKI